MRTPPEEEGLGESDGATDPEALNLKEAIDRGLGFRAFRVNSTSKNPKT